MNKLLVSDIINLNEGIYNIDFKGNKSIINVSGNVVIYIINQVINELIINLENESKLTIYKYDKLLKGNIKIKINQKHNSNIEYNSSYISEEDVNLTINNDILGNNNNSNIVIRNISNNNYSNIVINVKIKENTINNIALEDLKGINNGGFIKIEPNIICNSNEVTANHLTTIGILNQDEVNYLMSKGISEEKVKEILLNGFIYSNMDDYIKNLGGE